MRFALRMPLAAGALLLLSGCVVLWPRHETIVPEISGRVVHDGVPVAGAKVHVIADARANPSDRRRRTTETDAAGRFDVDAIREWTWFQYIAGPADRPQWWSMRIDDGDRRHVGWEPDGMAPPPARPAIAECDLARAPDSRHDNPGYRMDGAGVCALKQPTGTEGTGS